ncbi:SAM-dependent methyltransferase [Pseudoalteromonas sp. SMS1]|uniref:methyltransferase n=1 Tax=Pseudoalteromonas sp. SMS1 TaxID=2908894 RepID=UPI001F2E6819|nr:methyltransferase [Pseudoalteromonas sp. SMS1]MCF2858901.1 SAM-dependent methyltransferase [Pseudoalteromonas sp. SMS1]
MTSNFVTRFQALDQLLNETRQYWQLLAFDHLCTPWPELDAYLTGLSDLNLSALDMDQSALQHALANYIPQLNEISALIAVDTVGSRRPTLPFWLSNGIKGRKVNQLQDFVGALNEQHLPVLEWCAGKGHLGRILAFTGVPHVDSVELQAHLCTQGAHSAQQQGLAMTFHCADVLQDPVAHYFKPQQHAVALHACGQLHQNFMTEAAKAGCEKISLSPCCYHLFTPAQYAPMSEVAKRSQITLTHNDMKLALQETVTAPSRVAKVRKKEVLWRLAFDAIRRDVTGSDKYISVPSVNKAIFSGEFKAFCAWAAEQKGVRLPAYIDYAAYLEAARQRQQITERIELVRHAFRRAIEMWLVLDRALYLQEFGYEVALTQFCEKSLTPRNLLIQAAKQKHSVGEENVSTGEESSSASAE